MKINPKEISVAERQKLLTSGIGPRPIALVGSVSKAGIPNLSPFSFFNAFGANPPIVAFSPARRGRDGSLKDTYFNCKETKECTISMVSFSMVEQVSLSSTEYEANIDEFMKSGLIKSESEFVQASGVRESPFWMECKVLDIIHTGDKNGSGNIVICEVLLFHVDESKLNEAGAIDANKADIVGRFGGADYVRASGSALFEIPKPTARAVGFDQLPKFVLNSSILTANNLARLANETELPSDKTVETFKQSLNEEKEFTEALFQNALDEVHLGKLTALLLKSKKEKSASFSTYLDRAIKSLLNAWKCQEAWILLKIFQEDE